MKTLLIVMLTSSSNLLALNKPKIFCTVLFYFAWPKGKTVIGTLSHVSYPYFYDLIVDEINTHTLLSNQRGFWFQINELSAPP